MLQSKQRTTQRELLESLGFRRGPKVSTSSKNRYFFVKTSNVVVRMGAVDKDGFRYTHDGRFKNVEVLERFGFRFDKKTTKKLSDEFETAWEMAFSGTL